MAAGAVDRNLEEEDCVSVIALLRCATARELPSNRWLPVMPSTHRQLCRTLPGPAVPVSSFAVCRPYLTSRPIARFDGRQPRKEGKNGIDRRQDGERWTVVFRWRLGRS